jgi:hypothetical protein
LEGLDSPLDVNVDRDDDLDAFHHAGLSHYICAHLASADHTDSHWPAGRFSFFKILV